MYKKILGILNRSASIQPAIFHAWFHASFDDSGILLPGMGGQPVTILLYSVIAYISGIMIALEAKNLSYLQSMRT
jgi:hypothetical protein